VRVGVHLGDTIFEKGDIRGDGVNIASRLESMAVAGGVFVSKEVHDQLTNQKEFEGVSLGLQSMKGVGRLIEVYGLKGYKLSEPNPDEYQDNKIDKHSDDEVPSIAIIPFENKGKEEDVFYAYGISVDLISDVTSAGLIRVASLKQVEELGDLTVEEKAKKLNVRYISTGTLWKMGDMFQLSIELYDTKDKKVVWSDRWQESWDNLPTIKGSLSDGLLKALNTTSKVEKKVETTNPEAYEFYLRAKHKYDKRENKDDTEIARGLLSKAIELDNNLIVAKNLLGTTYREMGDYDKAMEIYTPALKKAEKLGDKPGMGYILNGIGAVHTNKGDYDNALDYFEMSLTIAEELGDKRGIGVSLNNIGLVQHDKGDYETALDYLERSLTIAEELGDKRGIGVSLNNIGLMYWNKGDYEKSLDYYGRSLAIDEELGDKRGVGVSLVNIGLVSWNKGDYDNALDYFERSLTIAEELGDKRGMGLSLNSIGIVHFNKGEYEKAEDYFENSRAIQKEIGLGADDLIWSTTYLYLTYKHLSKDYDVKEIHTLIKETENIEFDLNYGLYQLLKDISFLATAYNQIQEKADNLEPDVKAKFLSYPIPKAIVEEWEKVK